MEVGSDMWGFRPLRDEQQFVSYARAMEAGLCMVESGKEGDGEKNNEGAS